MFSFVSWKRSNATAFSRFPANICFSFQFFNKVYVWRRTAYRHLEWQMEFAQEGWWQNLVLMAAWLAVFLTISMVFKTIAGILSSICKELCDEDEVRVSVREGKVRLVQILLAQPFPGSRFNFQTFLLVLAACIQL